MFLKVFESSQKSFWGQNGVFNLAVLFLALGMCTACGPSEEELAENPKLDAEIARLKAVVEKLDVKKRALEKVATEIETLENKVDVIDLKAPRGVTLQFDDKDDLQRSAALKLIGNGGLLEASKAVLAVEKKRPYLVFESIATDGKVFAVTLGVNIPEASDDVEEDKDLVARNRKWKRLAQKSKDFGKKYAEYMKIERQARAADEEGLKAKEKMLAAWKSELKIKNGRLVEVKKMLKTLFQARKPVFEDGFVKMVEGNAWVEGTLAKKMKAKHLKKLAKRTGFKITKDAAGLPAVEEGKARVTLHIFDAAVE